MRFCRLWILSALCCVSLLAGVRPAEAQFPFEPGFEGELWQMLPPLGTRLRETCITYVDPNPNDAFPAYPDVSTLTCTDAQLAAILDEFAYPTDLVTLQVGTIPDPVTALPIPVFRLYVIDQIFGRVLTFLSGPNGTWTVDPLPDADWNFSNALNPTLSYPETIALDAANNVLIGDWGHSRIVAYTSEGAYKGEFPLPSEVVSIGAVLGRSVRRAGFGLHRRPPGRWPLLRPSARAGLHSGRRHRGDVVDDRRRGARQRARGIRRTLRCHLRRARAPGRSPTTATAGFRCSR